MRIRFAKWESDRFTEDADFWQKKKKHLFRWSSFGSWRVCKQAKLSHLVHRKFPRIHWKANTTKTSHCLVRSLVQRHNWAIFLWKWAIRVRYSQLHSLSVHVERIFFHKNWRGGYWQHLVLTGRRYVPHSRSYTRCFAPCFWRSHYQSQGWCLLATSELRFDIVGLLFVEYRQSVTPTSLWLDALKDIIREAIGEIQLHTTNNVLKNWADRVGYCMASRGSHLNEIIFHY